MTNNTVTADQYLQAFANAYCGGDVEKAKRQLIPQMVIKGKEIKEDDHGETNKNLF